MTDSAQEERRKEEAVYSSMKEYSFQLYKTHNSQVSRQTNTIYSQIQSYTPYLKLWTAEIAVKRKKKRNPPKKKLNDIVGFTPTNWHTLIQNQHLDMVILCFHSKQWAKHNNPCKNLHSLKGTKRKCLNQSSYANFAIGINI